MIKNDIKTIALLESIENNLNKVYTRTIGRINAFKWFIGACWMIFTLFQKQFIALAKNLYNNDIKYISIYNMEITINMIFITILIIIMVSAYKIGIDFIFKTIEFAINEYKVTIQINNNHFTHKKSLTYLKVK